jgi:hypothetical protein
VGVGEALFSETVCKAINLKTPVPYVPKGEGRFARTKGFENERSSSPYKQYEPEQRHASPVDPLPRRDLLLDDVDQKELEELESQTLGDKKLLQHFEDRAAERAEEEKRSLLVAQINKDEACLREKKLLLFGQHATEERQASLVKVTEPIPSPSSSRKHKGDPIQVLAPTVIPLIDVH